MRGWRGGWARGRRVENSGGGRGRGWRGGSVAFGRRLARNRREIRKRVAGPRGRLRRRKFLRAPLFEILFASLLALLARRRLGCLFGRGRRGRNDLRGWRRGNAARRQQRLHRVRESGLQRNAAFRRDLEAEAHTHLVLLPRLLYCRRLRLRYSNCLCRLRLCRQECLCCRRLPRHLRLRRLNLCCLECLCCRRLPSRLRLSLRLNRCRRRLRLNRCRRRGLNRCRRRGHGALNKGLGKVSRQAQLRSERAQLCMRQPVQLRQAVAEAHQSQGALARSRRVSHGGGLGGGGLGSLGGGGGSGGGGGGDGGIHRCRSEHVKASPDAAGLREQRKLHRHGRRAGGRGHHWRRRGGDCHGRRRRRELGQWLLELGQARLLITVLLELVRGRILLLHARRRHRAEVARRRWRRLHLLHRLGLHSRHHRLHHLHRLHRLHFNRLHKGRCLEADPHIGTRWLGREAHCHFGRHRHRRRGQRARLLLHRCGRQGEH